MSYVQNILSVYLSASETEVAEGMHWYDNAHNLALELSPDNVWRGAGVIAGYSVRQKWDINVRNARNAFLTGVATGHTKIMCNQIQRILDGEHPLDVFGGNKVRAFASAIVDPAGSKIATIDRHAYSVATGAPFRDKSTKIGKRLFHTLSDAYIEAAYLTDISVAQIQAITWVTWRNKKGVS